MGNTSVMSNLSHWAESDRGRISALARHLKVSPSFAHKLVHGKKPVPVEHGARIEAFTGVSRMELFPTTWREIWPELAQVSKAAPEANPQHEVAHSGGNSSSVYS